MNNFIMKFINNFGYLKSMESLTREEFLLVIVSEMKSFWHQY